MCTHHTMPTIIANPRREKTVEMAVTAAVVKPGRGRGRGERERREGERERREGRGG